MVSRHRTAWPPNSSRTSPVAEEPPALTTPSPGARQAQAFLFPQSKACRYESGRRALFVSSIVLADVIDTLETLVTRTIRMTRSSIGACGAHFRPRFSAAHSGQKPTQENDDNEFVHRSSPGKHRPAPHDLPQSPCLPDPGIRIGIDEEALSMSLRDALLLYPWEHPFKA